MHHHTHTPAYNKYTPTRTRAHAPKHKVFIQAEQSSTCRGVHRNVRVQVLRREAGEKKSHKRHVTSDIDIGWHQRS